MKQLTTIEKRKVKAKNKEDREDKMANISNK